jgi:CDK inhibitor PHO81
LIQTNPDLQDLVPKIIESIKTAGLVLISDLTVNSTESAPAKRQGGPPNDGLDGVLRRNGVLKFHESIDM